MFTITNSEKSKLSFENLILRYNQENTFLRKYFELNSSKIVSNSKKLERGLLNTIIKNPEDEVIINEIYETQIKSVLSFYFHSAITLVHSHLENQLVRLCEFIQSETNNKFSQSDLKGNDNIKVSLDYLELTTGLETDLINRYKPRIGKFQRLRNKIIHENSSYNNRKTKDALVNDFSTKIEFNDETRQFFLNSDELPIEYLKIASELIFEILSFLDSKEFLIMENPAKDNSRLPF